MISRSIGFCRRRVRWRPRAELIFEDKQLLDDGSIIEMRIWRVPTAVPSSWHEFKYSLFYGRPGQVVVLFDNERGKGDHKHVGGVETIYRFESPERLIEDFTTVVEAARKKTQ